jgi:hypothetical protein
MDLSTRDPLVTKRLNLFLVGAVMVVSCTVSPDVVLYNNTGFSVEVQFNDRRVELTPGASTRFNSDVLWNERLIIRTGVQPVRYEPPDGKFPSAWLRSGFLRGHFVAQLERDLTIHLVPPALDPPQVNSGEQPPGFPLLPRPLAGSVGAG